MRISDWSSDVCASDLVAHYLIGKANRLCPSTMLRMVPLPVPGRIGNVRSPPQSRRRASMPRRAQPVDLLRLAHDQPREPAYDTRQPPGHLADGPFHPVAINHVPSPQIARAYVRDTVCTYVSISLVTVALHKT